VGVDDSAVIEIGAATVWFAASMTAAGRLAARFEDDIDAVRLTVPAKPLMLVRLSVVVAVEPGLILRFAGLAAITKSGVVLVEKMAVWMVSGTGFGVPLAIVTQTLGVTLVPEHPVWNPSGVPVLGLVTL
jgi:hypothetical protein